MKNVLYQNGKLRPAVSSGGGGSKEMPVRFVGNFVYDTDYLGIGLQKGAVGIIEENIVLGTDGPGIAVNGSTALKLNRNKVKGAKGPGFVITDGAKVDEMVGIEPISKIRLGFRARRGTVKKRSIHGSM
jgi:hypothetical protein